MLDVGAGHGYNRIENAFKLGFENDFGNENKAHSGNEIIIDENTTNFNGLNDLQYVTYINYSEFRQELVNHFDILFVQNKIKWHTRTDKVMSSK